MKYFFLKVLFCLGSICIKSNESLNNSGRIVGGTDAQPHSAPYLVSIQWAILPTVTATHYCGGNLITSERILTAAHCIQTTGVMRAVGGVQNLDEVSNNHQTRDIIEAVPHEFFITSGPSIFDIAMFRVNAPFIMNLFVQTISLPYSGALHFGSGTVFGWGTTSNTTGNQIASNTLQTVDKEILHSIVCELYISNILPVSNNVICTGPVLSNIDVCGGDSGGPLVQLVDNNRFELVGIISWAPFPCGEGPSVHIRVSSFIDWILQKLLVR